MTSKLHHERIARGPEAMSKLSRCRILLCGAGALGSNLAVNLVRMGVKKLTIVDKDRVEEHNISTQIYGLEDIGALKAEMVRNMIFRDVGEEITSLAKEVNQQNAAKLLKGFDLIIDTFDNSASRRLVKETCISLDAQCLHAGVNDQYGEVIWNARYRVPSDEGVDVCDYPLSRTLVLLVVSIASEVAVRYILSGEQQNYSVTTGDFSINREY
ncbi:MAG TPA: ThiF family adenylyltransferase [Candidatus Obscuribacterales bacterium]